MKLPVYKIEITNESGEIVVTHTCTFEADAHFQFEQIEKVRSPFTYMNLTMNLSEEFTGGNIGSVRVVREDSDGTRYVLREKWRNA